MLTLSLATIIRVCLSLKARYLWNWLSADDLVLMVEWFWVGVSMYTFDLLTRVCVRDIHQMINVIKIKIHITNNSLYTNYMDFGREKVAHSFNFLKIMCLSHFMFLFLFSSALKRIKLMIKEYLGSKCLNLKSFTWICLLTEPSATPTIWLIAVACTACCGACTTCTATTSAATAQTLLLPRQQTNR